VTAAIKKVRPPVTSVAGSTDTSVITKKKLQIAATEKILVTTSLNLNTSNIETIKNNNKKYPICISYLNIFK